MATVPNSIIQPQSMAIGNANLSAVSACTSRGPTLQSGITSTPIFGVSVVGTSSNGQRIDKVQAKGSATAITGATLPATIILYDCDGTNCFPVDEILVTAVTPSTAVASFIASNTYQNFVLPPTHSLYAATTVATTTAANAMVVTAFGGAY